MKVTTTYNNPFDVISRIELWWDNSWGLSKQQTRLPVYVVIIGKVWGCPGRMSIFDGVVQLVYELNVHRAMHVTIGKHMIYMI